MLYIIVCLFSIFPDTEAIKHYADFLRKIYELYPIGKWDKLSIPSERYINLALVRKEENISHVEELKELTLYGNIDQILKRKESVKIECVVKDDTRLVVVEGGPGAGKSVLMWELCRQWPKIASLAHFSLVVFLSLRDEVIIQSKVISDLLYHRNSKLSMQVGEIVEENEGEGVLFILDGFDELPSHLRNNSLISDIIHGSKYLPKAKVVVSSRPSALVELKKSFMQASRHLEILGFTETDFLDFASAAFNNDANTLSNFRRYLLVNPVVARMMHNPLNCAIIVNVYKNTVSSERPIPQTLTQLYTELTLCLISRYLSAAKDPFATELPNSLEDIPHDSNIYKQLEKIGEMAFKGILINEIIFKELPGGCSDLGLLVEHKALSLRSKISTFNFIHVTLQEYFAAFYISLQQPSTQEKLLLENRELTQVVWRFVAGLTRMEKIGWDIFQKVKSELYKSRFEYEVVDAGNVYEEDVNNVVWGGPLLFLCLYEAQDTNIIKDFFGKNKVSFKTESLLDSPECDLYAHGYCIAASGSSFLCDLSCTRNSLYNMSSSLEMFGLGMKSVDKCFGRIEELNMSHCPGILMSHSIHCCLPQSIIKHIKTLYLRDCDMRQEAFENLRRGLCYLSALEHLDVSNNLGAKFVVKELMLTLSTHKQLRTINLTDVPYDSEDVTGLVTLVKESVSLKEFHFGSSQAITSTKEALDLEQEIERTLLNSPTLETVGLLTQCSNVEGISQSITTLAIVPTAQIPGDGAGERWSKLIADNTSLRYLKLHIAMDKVGFDAMLSNLEVNISLERLELSSKLHADYVSTEIRRALKPRVIFT